MWEEIWLVYVHKVSFLITLPAPDSADTGEQQFHVKQPSVPSLVVQGTPADLHSPGEHEGFKTHITTQKSYS